MRPKILFLCTACPFGTIGGSGLRTLYIARLLEKIGPVTMVAATDRPWTDDQVAQTKAAFNLVAYFKLQASPTRGIFDWLRKTFDTHELNTNGVIAAPSDVQNLQALIKSHDIIWVHTIKLANAFRIYRWSNSVIDVDDIPSRYHAMAAPLAPNIKTKLQRRRSAWICRRHEAKLLNRFSVLTLCKESDRAYFSWDKRAHVVPNGFAAPEQAPKRQLNPQEPRLGMIGDFGHLPNSDGAAWFIKHVLPELRQKVPGFRLRLMGKKSTEIASQYNDPAVVGLGYVPDTGLEIATWSAMIVPTRQGGGTHLKVAEGLGRRVPMVTTRHGSRGYQLEDKQHALIADTPETFSAACLKLLQNQAEGEKLAAAGWELFNQHYSWDSIGPAVEATVHACLSRQSNQLEATPLQS